MTRVRRRIVLAFLLALGATLFLTSRLAYLQIVEGERLSRLALEQRLRPVPVDARRGTIFDRHFNELAVSVSSDAVLAIPAQVEDPAGTAATLAPLLEVPREELEERLRRRQASVWLSRRIEEGVARQIRRLDLPGIEIVQRTARLYPNGSLAAHVLGFTGIDNQGLEGLEMYYDRLLAGEPGRVVTEHDAANRRIPDGLTYYLPPQDGYDLVLTIDRTIQYIAERELAEQVAASGAERGVLIAMEPQTGKILAMANYPGFDPNHYNRYPVENRRNTAVVDEYEPGSIFKVVTGASALEEGVVTPSTGFFDPGFLLVGDRPIRCHRSGGHGALDFTEATAVSCNTVYATLSLHRLGPQRFYRYVKAFGFGARTGIDFPGEATGTVHPPGSIKWGEDIAFATMGFGQSITVTPLQMVTALSAVANGGWLMRPYLVEQVRDREGRVVEAFSPTVVRRVLSQETARTYARILREVVVDGSGRRADVPGYEVAGKTGTAQVAEEGGGGYGSRRHVSFMGFAPYDDPKIAILVTLFNMGPGSFGGVWAAPVFAQVAADTLPYLGVKPVAQEAPPALAAGGEAVRVPNVLEFPVAEARQVLRKAGLEAHVIGRGGVVAQQLPSAGETVVRGTSVNLYLEDAPLYNEGEPEVTVPDLRGRTVDEATSLLSQLNLAIEVLGQGVAVRQFPAPGSPATAGAVVTVEFRSSGE